MITLWPQLSQRHDSSACRCRTASLARRSRPRNGGISRVKHDAPFSGPGPSSLCQRKEEGDREGQARGVVMTSGERSRRGRWESHHWSRFVQTSLRPSGMKAVSGGVLASPGAPFRQDLTSTPRVRWPASYLMFLNSTRHFASRRTITRRESFSAAIWSTKGPLYRFVSTISLMRAALLLSGSTMLRWCP